MITEGQRETDNINQMKTLTKLTVLLLILRFQIDHINRTITLSLITFGGFHCIIKNVQPFRVNIVENACVLTM